MKTIIQLTRSILMAMAGLCLLNSSVSHSQENMSLVTTNPADHAACEKHLNRIHGAIQQYLLTNQKLPRWLSDLAPDYLPASVLICPFVDRTGRFKEWRNAYRNYPVFSDPQSCSYAYELCTVEIAKVPGLTTREYKQRQMAMIGFGVPVVRCLAHGPILNLGVDGSIYFSPSEWEDNFVVAPKYKTTLHNVWMMTLTRKKSLNEIVREMLEPRSAEAKPTSLDLTDYYNASLLHLSRIESSGKLQRSYPEGLQKVGGVDFDIRGLVHLSGANLPDPFPLKVANIAINQKCDSVNFLHGATSPAPAGTKIASYVLRFADGSTNEVPVLYGKDVKARWIDPQSDPEYDQPKAAWIGKYDGPHNPLRIYLTRWRIPNRGVELESIDFISHQTAAAPFLIAISVD